MEVQIRSFESARRALSYLGERSCDQLCAFDADPVVADVEVGQRGLEKPTHEKGEATDALVLGFWASGGGADWINRKRSACSILPAGALLR